MKFSNDDRADVGKEMSTRTGKQCRERYHNHLKVGIKKGYWSAEEDALIKQVFAEHGGCWTHIASVLPGRTGNAVKSRWQYLIKGIIPDTVETENPSKTSGSQQLQALGASKTPTWTSQQSVDALQIDSGTSQIGKAEIKPELEVMDKDGPIVGKIDFEVPLYPYGNGNYKRNISNISDMYPHEDSIASLTRQESRKSIDMSNEELFDTLQSYLFTQNPQELCRRLSTCFRHMRRKCS